MCSHQHENHILCPQCDLLVALPMLRDGTKAVCPRCKTTLRTRWPEPHRRPTAYAFCALLMLLLANLFPFVNMRVAGITSEISLIEIPHVLVAENFVSMASFFMIFVQLVPAFCMLSIILLCQKVRLPFRVKTALARALFTLKPWCMVEIFLAGVLVSFVKLMSYGDVGIGSSFIPCCLFSVLQVRALQCIDRRWLWDVIAVVPEPVKNLRTGVSGIQQGVRSCPCCTAILPVDVFVCPRCLTKGHARRKNSLQWTMALLVTSMLLYIPANLLPIMITQALGNRITSTIMGGVVLLWGHGSYPVALVIFIASIMVPSLKMIAIAWLCWDANGKGQGDSEKMHFLYELVEFVGRWSMIDVFVIAVLASLVRMGQLMNIYPDIGVLLFALVVVLTMFAAITFDPRLTWDRDNRKTQDKGLQCDSK